MKQKLHEVLVRFAIKGNFPPSEAEKSIFILFEKTEFKHST